MENNNYLAHHGTKGQRWGERRYQNPDGSLTPEGRRHYGYGDGTRSSRDELRAQIKMAREKARAERKMARVQTTERIRYERQRQKLDAKLEKAKSAEKIKESRQREKDNARKIRDQKKQIANYRRMHPLKYQKMRKYITKDGVLSDEGQMKFFGNGKKKTTTNMSNQDLKEATNRMYLKNKYNEQVANYKAHDTKSRIANTTKKVFGTGAAVFAGSFLAKSAKDALSDGVDSVNYRENGKKAAAAAIGAMGIKLTNELGLSGKKGNKAYNAFELGRSHGKDDNNQSNNGKKQKTPKTPKSSKNVNTSKTTSSKTSSTANTKWTYKSKNTSETGTAYRFNTSSSSTSDNVGRMRRAAHAGSSFVDTFNSVYGNRSSSTASADSPQVSRALSVIENVPTSMTYSEIAGYLPARHS